MPERLEGPAWTMGTSQRNNPRVRQAVEKHGRGRALERQYYNPRWMSNSSSSDPILSTPHSCTMLPFGAFL